MGVVDRAASWNLDLDEYINHIVPPSQLSKLPTPVSRFLGYRKEQDEDVGNILGAFWSCLGAFCGLAVVAAVFNNTSSIQHHHPPALIASFGASAILEYNAIRSPLGQPRNALLGHTFSALIGVGITKLFLYHSEFEKIRWIAGAISCGVASAVMLLTGTVHPPGGASAVLAATSPEVTQMGWYFVGLVLWGSTLMLFVGLAVNNVQRRFPVYWWTPAEVGRDMRRKKGDEEGGGDEQGSSGNEDEKKEQGSEDEKEGSRAISISAHGVTLPEVFALNREEAEVLERLRDRLRKEGDSARSSADMTMVSSRGIGGDSDASVGHP